MVAKDMTGVLAEAPVGLWIALSKDESRIVGKGKTIQQAIKAAKKNGEDKPLLMKVPEASALIL